MGFFKEMMGIVITVFAAVVILLLLLLKATIPEFIPSLTIISVILTSISVIVAIATFYLIHIKGPDITLKVHKNGVLESSINTSIPALFINEGGKPGVLFRDFEWESPSVSLPKFLKDFGSRAEIKFDTTESHIKLAPGESIASEITIFFIKNEYDIKVSDKLKELNNLFIKYKEITFTVEFFTTTKEGIEGREENFKLRTKIHQGS